MIRWLPAVGLFVYIDLIGYIPGRSPGTAARTKQISKVYYVLYNVMHSMITQTVVIGVWGLFIGWEWALLVVPFHLFGDRGLFGNFLKPFGLSFEPQPHPAYAAVVARLDARPRARRLRDRQPVRRAPASPAEAAPIQPAAQAERQIR